MQTKINYSVFSAFSVDNISGCLCPMCVVRDFFWEYLLPHLSQTNWGPVTHSYFSCRILFLLYLYFLVLQIEQINSFSLSFESFGFLAMLFFEFLNFFFNLLLVLVIFFRKTCFRLIFAPIAISMASDFTSMIFSSPLVNGNGVLQKVRLVGGSGRANNEKRKIKIYKAQRTVSNKCMAELAMPYSL